MSARPEDITDERIEQLLLRARYNLGAEDELARLCWRALEGDDRARARVAQLDRVEAL